MLLTCPYCGHSGDAEAFDASMSDEATCPICKADFEFSDLDHHDECDCEECDERDPNAAEFQFSTDDTEVS